jgi:hypothetical protein
MSNVRHQLDMGRGTQRFFRYLWRANAVVIFGAACAVLVVIGPLLFAGILHAVRRSQDPGPPLVQQREPGQRPLTLCGFSLIDGTNTARAELSVARSDVIFGSSSEYFASSLSFTLACSGERPPAVPKAADWGLEAGAFADTREWATTAATAGANTRPGLVWNRKG